MISISILEIALFSLAAISSASGPCFEVFRMPAGNAMRAKLTPTTARNKVFVF